MLAASHPVLVVPELTIFDASAGRDVRLTDVGIDADYVRDEQGRVRYFSLDEAEAYLHGAGKSLPSLPLLLNIYLALADMASGDEIAAHLLEQLDSAWDRCGTTIDPAEGCVIHADSVTGERVHTGLSIPLEGDALEELFPRYPGFFQALLGVRDVDRLLETAARRDKVPFYWYPRGPRRVMFGGGNFYYMHTDIPGLLMVFCDDEPHPRRTLRGVWC